MRSLILLAFSLSFCTLTRAQSCPAASGPNAGEAPEASTVHGVITYHDDLRQWLGIRLETPVCGEGEVQLVFSDPLRWREMRALAGCGTTVGGNLYDSPTGYYSAKLAMSDPGVEQDASCHPAAVEPDLTLVPVAPDLPRFRASIRVDYRGKGHVDVNVWKVDGKRHVALTPWEAYVNYLLTGSLDVLWFNCRKGFSPESITQTPRAKNEYLWNGSDSPGTTLEDVNGTNTVEFKCEKK